MLDPVELIRELVALPGPPGREGPVRDAVAAHVEALGYSHRTDAKGNLLVEVGGEPDAHTRAVVTAHLDEIALMVAGIEPDGLLRVSPLGGAHPWKWGEQPVDILAREETVPAVLSFGSIHTESPLSVAQQAREKPLTWDLPRLFTGLTREELRERGVRPGVRVALGSERRGLKEFGSYLAAYFLDDRADLAAWLMALEVLRDAPPPGRVVFAATAAEEVGGEGAYYLLQELHPDVCVALEIGPSVPESCFRPDAQPTIWVNDSFSAMSAHDLEELADLCASLGQRPHWQALSRGGSDASAAASKGYAARPITLGLPMENTHGYEIMHRSAPGELARLLVAWLRKEG